MNNLITIFFLLLLACRVSNNTAFDTKISKKILIAQDNYGTFANSAYWRREEFMKKVKKINISESDTLFLFERIGEPDLDIWSNVWTSKRDVVHEYKSDLKGGGDTVMNYKEWQNYYKEKVERFDTTTIDKHKILGGYRSFMTQVIRGKEVKTFFFDDSYSSFHIGR
jgi:hypothetical protein